MKPQYIVVQTKIKGRKSVARVRCGTCYSDYFDVIQKGKNKELTCQECKDWCKKVDKKEKQRKKRKSKRRVVVL